MRKNRIICFVFGVMLVAPAWAGETTIVSNVLGPEGPLYVDGNLYYVGWVSNTLSKWDGKTTTVLNHTAGCGHNGLALTKEKTFLLACTEEHGAILELDLTGKQLRRMGCRQRRQAIRGRHQRYCGARQRRRLMPRFSVPTRMYRPPWQEKFSILLSAVEKWVEVADDLNYANGIGVSPDQKTLYVSETVGNCLLKFKINDDGLE